MIKEKFRNYTLDTLRAIAAFMVVMFHLNEPIVHIDNWYRNSVKFGWLGVPVFFIISGYCVMISAYQTKFSIKFMLRRLFRIYPPYWISLLLIVLIAIFQKVTIGFNSVSGIPKNFVELMAHLSLLTSPFTTVKTTNWVYWSLTYELFFYGILALVMLLPMRSWLSVISCISIASIFIPIKNSGFLFFINQWPTFSLGVAAYSFHYLTGTKRWVYFPLLTIVSCVGIHLNSVTNVHDEYFLASIITFIIIIASKYVFLKPTLISRLGDYSYSVYLIHVPLGIFLLGNLKRVWIQNNVFFNLIYDFVVYIIVCTLSYFLFKTVELKSIKLGRNFANSLKLKIYAPTDN